MPLQIACEVLLVATLVGGMLIAAIIVVRDVLTTRKELADIDLSRVLSQADDKINEPLRTTLANGDVRLLRCSWVASPEADAYLDRDPDTGTVRMKRMQDLPEKAFFSPQEAAALLDRADRSIIALSYRWLTALHPEPRGTTLLALRRLLDSTPDMMHCGLFWDYASLPQRGLDGSDRTEEETSVFKRGLKVMAFFYASITGTAVVQLKDVPDCPPSTRAASRSTQRRKPAAIARGAVLGSPYLCRNA